MIQVEGPSKRDGTIDKIINDFNLETEVIYYKKNNIFIKNRLEELKDYLDSVDVLDGRINVRMLARRLEEILKLL